MPDGTRVVKVSREFFAQLAEYLEPTERWSELESSGLILWTVSIPADDGPVSKKLIFAPIEEGQR